ncbi:MAG: T9SS type A sorting domain-containing protein [Ignavibacteriaceae bacterium]
MKSLKLHTLLILLSVSFYIHAQDYGESILLTTYDYLYTAPHCQIITPDYNNDGIADPVIFLLYRSYELPHSYNLYVFYKEDNLWYSILPFQPNGRLRGIQYCTGGPLDGKILAAARTETGGTEFSVIDPQNWQFNTYGSDISELWSFHYSPDGVIYGMSRSPSVPNDHQHIYKSSDLGVTFQQFHRIGEDHPQMNFIYHKNSSSIKSSFNNQFLSVISSFEQTDTSTSNKILYLTHSTDFGASWHGQVIGRDDEYGQVSNRNYAPLFTNFSQLDYEVDNDGKTHVIINGYGRGVIEGSSDTSFVYPVLYWNNNYDKWFAVTNVQREYPTDGFGNLVNWLFPAHGIGNAYPSISITKDGKNIFLLWQTFEYTAGYNTPFNIFPGNGIDPVPIYYTDLMYRFGFDDSAVSNEVQWSEEGTIADELINNSRTEQYPLLSPFIDDQTGSSLQAHYIYQHDDIPGAGAFFQNLSSPGTGWFYKTYNFSPTSVDDIDLTVINDFKLEQNYPNPFNPSTIIRYQIPDNGYVTLKVYDVLGSEVTTLVDEYKNAGRYEGELNGKELTSGVYFYQFRSNGYVQTKKMILIK